MDILVAEIQTNLRIWTCCNQIQQYSPFIIYAMWVIFNRVAEICVTSLDKRLFLCFYCNIYEMKPEIFEIFRTFSYLGDFP